MPRIPAIPAAGNVRDNRKFTLAAAQTFKDGALVLMDASEDIAECGADPAAIFGVALEPATKDPEGVGVIIVMPFEEGAKVWIDGDNDPTKADINQEYGVTKDGDGIWHLDGTKTGASARLYVHNVDLDVKRYLVSVLAANRQVSTE
jgi:hypothetical protein